MTVERFVGPSGTAELQRENGAWFVLWPGGRRTPYATRLACITNLEKQNYAPIAA